MKVIYSRFSLDYLNDLISILHLKNYFGLEEYAIEYVDSPMEQAKNSIHIKQKYRAPDFFSRYGKDLWYACYPKNKRTT